MQRHLVQSKPSRYLILAIPESQEKFRIVQQGHNSHLIRGTNQKLCWKNIYFFSPYALPSLSSCLAFVRFMNLCPFLSASSLRFLFSICFFQVMFILFRRGDPKLILHIRDSVSSINHELVHKLSTGGTSVLYVSHRSAYRRLNVFSPWQRGGYSPHGFVTIENVRIYKISQMMIEYQLKCLFDCQFMRTKAKVWCILQHCWLP